MKHASMKIIALALFPAVVVACAPTETQNAEKAARTVAAFQNTAMVEVPQQPETLTYLYLPVEPVVFGSELAAQVKTAHHNATLGQCNTNDGWRGYFDCTSKYRFSTEKVGEFNHRFSIESSGKEGVHMRLLSVKAGKLSVFPNLTFQDNLYLHFLVAVQQERPQPGDSFSFALKFEQNRFRFQVKITDPAPPKQP